LVFTYTTNCNNYYCNNNQTNHSVLNAWSVSWKYAYCAQSARRNYKSHGIYCRLISIQESAYIVLFLFAFGSLSEIFKVSGGIKGFAGLADRYVKTEKGALLAVWAATPVTFLDCCFHGIATGTIANPLIEKVGGSKEKLAMVVNITSSQLIVLMPVATTYVGYIVGVTGSAMRQAGLKGSPYSLFLHSIPFNFYSIGMVILSFLVIFFGLGFGKWKFGKLGKNEGVSMEQMRHTSNVNLKKKSLLE
jgi:Na+/H+ antiporter NhaC